MFKLTIKMNDESHFDFKGISALDRCRQLGIPDLTDLIFRDQTGETFHRIEIILTESEARSFTGRFQNDISRMYHAVPSDLSACHVRLDDSGYAVLDSDCSREAWLELAHKHNSYDRWL